MTIIVVKGGPGSGHRGHKGRKGQIGGSVADTGSTYGDGKALDILAFTPYATRKTVLTSNGWYMSDKSPEDRIVAIEYPGMAYTESERSYAKDNLVKNLSKDTSIPYEQVNHTIQSWAISSNDDNYQSLMQQKVAAEVLGLELSEFQQNKLDAIESIRSQRILDGDPLYESLRTVFEDENGKIDSVSTGGRTNREAARDITLAMYKRTQDYFAEKGIKEVTIFRGFKPEDESKPGYAVGIETGTIDDLTMNAIESWSINYSVATSFKEYSGVILAMTIPVTRILATPFTGFGCLTEFEMIVMNGNNDKVTVVEGNK